MACFDDCIQALYSPDSKTLATAHTDGKVRLWDVPPRKPVLAILGMSLVLWLSVLVAIRSVGTNDQVETNQMIRFSKWRAFLILILFLAAASSTIAWRAEADPDPTKLTREQVIEQTHEAV